MSDEIVVVQPIQTVVLVQEQTAVIEISGTGQQGPTGAQGLTPIFSKQNELLPLTGKMRFYFDNTRIISQIRASVGTPSTGASVVVDTLINGVSIGTVTIPAGQNTATLVTNKTVYANDYATVSILSVGTTTTGSDLTLMLTVN